MGKTVIAYEDEPTLRTQLENIFYAIREDFLLLASYGEPSDVLQHLVSYKPNVVIMDIQMDEEEDGLNALYKIKKANPEMKVMMLTTFDVDDKVFKAICLGADGYMLKSDFSSHQVPHEAMRRSLRVLFDGGAYLTPKVAKQILSLFADHTIADRILDIRERFQAIFQKESAIESKRPHLTKMQIAVLKKIVEGKSTPEIARELELKENTINTHIKAIYTALGVHSRAKAVKKAIEERWIR
ncbi:MAG: response regulator transcription factor [Saprospiraceae bacterium]